jgi:hypothetical protein
MPAIADWTVSASAIERRGGSMPAERGRGRYFVAAILLALEVPALMALAVGAPTRARLGHES